jgi:hypothetical protein
VRGGVVRGKIPLWLKVAYTAFVAVLVPYYWHTYGPVNFLWFCDIALLVTLAALWLESPFALVLLPLCYFFTARPPAPAANPTAAVNLNWVFGPGENAIQTWMAPGLYLALQLAFWPLVIYVPSHLIFRRLFPRPQGGAP